jgi:ATP-binding cassette subfamily B protein
VSGHEEEVVGRAYDHRLMRRLLTYLKPYRWQVVGALAVVLLDAVVQLAGPYLTKEAIDHGIRAGDRVVLDRVAVLYLTVLLVGFGLGYLQTQIMQRVGQHIMYDLRLRLFEHLQRLPLSYFDRNPVGRVMTRLTNDVDVLNEMFTSGVVAIFGDVFTLIGILIAMSQLNAELLGVAFSVLPLIFIATFTFRSLVRVSFRDIRTRLARLNAFLNENLSGMGTIQVLNREPHNEQEFRTINAHYRDANLQAVRYHAIFFPIIDLVGALAVSLIVWYGGRQVMWTGITLGTLVAFIQYTQRFFRPISDMSEKYNILQSAMASSERIFELLDTPVDTAAARSLGPEPVAGRREAEAALAATPPASAGSGDGVAASAGAATPGVEITRRLRGEIEFDHVWFAYLGQDWVLKDVSFRVAPGEKLAVVGSTGAGKTTLINLLLRFYEPQRGEIRVDGKPLSSLDVRSFRRHVGLVLQDVFLFSGTIGTNLSLGDPAMDRARLEWAAREVHAHPFIERLPGGYEAAVVERGATLSMGQRQLLAFARALAYDPQVLVLDEATSSVDTETESLIQDALRRLLAGRTSVIIAHRLSTLQDADRILVLHHGQVREEGSHGELLALGGIYYRLYRLQFPSASLGSARAE